MKRVTGVGGVFFRSKNPEAATAFYEKHLGIPKDEHGGLNLAWRELDGGEGLTVVAPFKEDTEYFGASDQQMMVNFRVDDLDALLADLAKSGIPCLGRDDSEFGKFAWIHDPDGRRVELWQPPKA